MDTVTGTGPEVASRVEAEAVGQATVKIAELSSICQPYASITSNTLIWRGRETS